MEMGLSHKTVSTDLGSFNMDYESFFFMLLHAKYGRDMVKSNKASRIHDSYILLANLDFQFFILNLVFRIL